MSMQHLTSVTQVALCTCRAVDEEERPLSLRRTDRKKRRRDYDDEDYEEPRLR